MAEIKNVTGTAFVAAEFRAEENAESNPLYRDPIAPLFLNRETAKAAEHIATAFPPIKKMAKLRTRYFDDKLDEQLDLDYRQVVILGSGLDTRAMRKQAPGVVYFEIDNAETLSLKKAKLKENNIHATVKFIPGDYVAEDFIRLLEDNEFNCKSPTYFIWEGNTMYLTAESVRKVMAEISQHVMRFTLSFDYLAEEVIANTTGDPGITILNEKFAAMGAPINYGIGDINLLAKEALMTVVDNVKMTELHRIHWPDLPVDSAVFDFYCLSTLKSQ
jgi:methyltransferase (TIGR00027 family)